MADDAANPAKLKCFLSYRRQDTNGSLTVGRIYDRFVTHFGQGNAFMDVDDIPPGADFRQVLADAVGRADVLLAVIGPQWSEIMQQRRGDARDFVRIEIESALTRGIPVVPLLIGGAAMPTAGDLPESLHELQFRNAFHLDPGRDFHAHVTRLIRDLERHYLAESGPPKPEPAPAEPLKTENLKPKTPFQNSLGMKFVPVPGLPESTLFSVWQTRVRDYAAFAAENPGIDRSWENVTYDGHKQAPDHPVVRVSWEESKAFCEWLSRKEGTGRIYRLPTDHEWSVAVGIGDREDAKASPASKSGKIEGVYPWGSKFPPPANTCNWDGEKRFPFTSPVGSFSLEHHGVKDLSGNVWEWCEDWFDANQTDRVLRGGSWGNSNVIGLRSSYRGNDTPANRSNVVGFRCVLELSSEG